GRLLRERLQNAGPGPKVVLHLAGAGEHATSPLRLSGADLVLYFEPPQGKAKPLTLVPDPNTCGDKPALIEAEGGGLDMDGARVALPNSFFTASPLRAVRVQSGHLRLFRCRLQGPLGKPPAVYEELIRFEAPGREEPERAAVCAFDRCVLQSGKA